MNFLVISLKGGVGKSSIALNLAHYFHAQYITNDLITSNNSNAKQISPKLKRIPKQYVGIDNVVYDFGAMSTNIDPKVAQAVKYSDVIIIPTLTDQRSLQATVESYKLVKSKNKPIVIIINNFTSWKKYHDAQSYLTTQLGNPAIYSIRTTTLFERIANDGVEWLDRINHERGAHQLIKTMQRHQNIYDLISQAGKGDTNEHTVAG